MRDLFILVILTIIGSGALLLMYFSAREARYEKTCYAEIPTVSVTDNNGVPHDNGYIRIEVACSDIIR